MMTDVEASVIIPAHNAEAMLGQQLEALALQEEAPPFEVIVVANRCTDKTVDVAARYNRKLNLRVIVADAMASAANARNVGASKAAGPYLLFCDADDRVARLWVVGIVETFRSTKADFVGGLIQVDRNGLPDWVYRWRYEFFDQRCIREQDGLLPYALSASLGVRRRPFHDIGGFDTRFPGAGGEEVDLAWRLLRAGYRIGEAKTAAVSYTPRLSVKANLAQARSYARGSLVLAAKEGALGPCPSLWQVSKSVIRTSAHQVLRKHEFHPLAIYARAKQQFDRWSEHRAFVAQKVLDSAPPSRADFAAPLSTPIIGGLAFSAMQASEARWYSRTGLEARSLAALERLLPEGGVFVDVGANIGVFTIAAALHSGPEGHVVAFEPSERARSLLRMNAQRHRVSGRVQIRQDAIGQTHESRVFREYANSVVSGFGLAPRVFYPGVLVAESKVEVLPLSAAVQGRVDVLKIDVEGYEPLVLEGARPVLERNPNIVLLVEMNPASLQAAGFTVDDLLDQLPSEEWDSWLIEEAQGRSLGVPPLLDRSRWRGFLSDGRSNWYANLLCTRKARAHLINIAGI